MSLGIWLLGLAAIATGIINLLWGTFDPAHQPIQAWGDPGRQTAFADAVGVALIAGGAMVLWGRTARFGAVLVAVAYSIFAIFWLPRLYVAPHYLGWRAPVLFGVISGIFTELVVVAGALIVYAWGSGGNAAHETQLTRIARWVFGLGAVAFGLNHLGSVQKSEMLIYVPHWMPFGREFWVAFTGVAFVLAGIAILSRVLDRLASWLLGLMFLVFSAVTLIPGLIIEMQRPEADWGGNAYEFAIVGACWIYAAWLTRRLPARGAAP